MITIQQSKWDEKTQQYHGGQEWSTLNNFIEDFSVTTNGLGTPGKALNAAREALQVCHHYPAADQEPAKTHLAKFIDPSSHASVHSRLLLGNGASELIDLVTRIAPEGAWKPGPSRVQYMEYERSASALGREIVKCDNKSIDAALTCIVNPNNPTGDYMDIKTLKDYIESNCVDKSVVMVDESMQIWHSDEFRSDSLISQSSWIDDLYTRRGIAVYIMHSWTKIWSCTGLRLGSLLCPTLSHAAILRKIQVPWSVNVAALAFLEVVTTQESDYMQKTWDLTTLWRKELVDRIMALKPPGVEWEISGAPFLSWVWIDFGDEAVALDAIERARAAGVPVRPGVNGYNCPTCVRAAVRETKQIDVLIKSWVGLATA